MNEQLRSLQDKFWNAKELCDDIATRKLSPADVAVLQAVERDLDRLHGRIVGIRDKYKRGPKAPPPAPPAPQQGLGLDGNGGNHG